MYSDPIAERDGVFILSMLFEQIEITGNNDPRPSCWGVCPRCGVRHELPVGPAGTYARELLHTLMDAGRIDVHVGEELSLIHI